jgi:hypothetical protein
VELDRYEGVPHLINTIPETEITIGKFPFKLPGSNTGIASDLPMGASFMRWVDNEIDHRNKLFKNDPKRPRNLEEYNRYHRKNHLPYIVVIIDELMGMMDKSGAINQTELELIKFCRSMILSVLRLGRSNGISLCGFTQSLDRSSSVGIAFKTNASMRIGFSVPDATSSTLVIGDGDAINLHPAGRAICKNSYAKLLVQTPYITINDINEAILIAKSGRQNVAFTSNLITPEEIVRWSVNDNEMSLRTRDVENRFKGLVTYEILRDLLNRMDNNEYEVDGDRYSVLPGIGQKQRRVIRIDQE